MNDIKTTVTTNYEIMYALTREVGEYSKVTCTNLKDSLKVARLAIAAGAVYATVSIDTVTEVHTNHSYERRNSVIDISFHPDEPVCFSRKYMYLGNNNSVCWFKAWNSRFKGKLY